MIRLGPLAVEVGGAGQEPVDPVAVAVAPGRDGAARRVVVTVDMAAPVWPLNMVRNSGPGQDVAGGVAVVGRRRCR